MAPRSAASPKMTNPALPMTQLFYCRILFHTKNVDVCKKLEVNPLRFDWDIRGLSLKKNILKIFYFFALWTKNAVNLQAFQIFEFFVSTWSIITALFFMWFNMDTTGHKKAPKSQNMSISGISQLLLIQFWWNFKERFLGTSKTNSNGHGDICQGNICPGNTGPY